MANRKALLIGADQYGEGFAALPAVRHDVEVVDRALRATGYETEICSDQVVANAIALDAAIRTFCRSAGPDDIRVVYFSGHGLRIDGKDWIVPRGTSRRDAAESVNQRVATDLSATVAGSRAGLVLFVVDACRAPEDVPV